MAEQLELNLKILLRKLLIKSDCKISMNDILSDLQKQNDRALNRSLLKTLNDIFQHDPVAYQLYNSEFQVNLRTMRPLECLRKLLVSYNGRLDGTTNLCDIKRVQQATIAEEKEPISDEFLIDTTSTHQHVKKQLANSKKDSVAVPLTSKDIDEFVKKMMSAANGKSSKSASMVTSSPRRPNDGLGSSSGNARSRNNSSRSPSKNAQTAKTEKIRAVTSTNGSKRTLKTAISRSEKLGKTSTMPVLIQAEEILYDESSALAVDKLATTSIFPAEKQLINVSPKLELPILSSTIINTCNVQDIMKKVVKAASDGLSKSAKNSSVTISATVSDTLSELSTLPQRPHRLWYFNEAATEALATIVDRPNFLGVPIERQEQLIVDDLLYIFIGIPANYITPIFSNENNNSFAPIKFEISDQIDVSLREIAKDILPIASHYSIIQKFAQLGSQVNNQIIQALCAALQSIINSYCDSVIQLETQMIKESLSLHQLMYYIRPNMQMLGELANVINKIGSLDLTGGKILTLLYDEVTLLMGDVRSQGIVIELTEQAAAPYFEILELWILKGVIIDKHRQFFVVDHNDEINGVDSSPNQDTARYWESRYTIQRDRIPKFLENDADIILRTGKYLNVIRQCGRQICPPNELSKLAFSATTQTHSTCIKKAYYHASQSLLQMLDKQYNLMGHITSVKRYFLLQQGDFITQFMDASEEELNKNVDKVTPVRLDNLLQLIVRISSAKNDPCLEGLHCDLFTMDLLTQMSKIHIAGNNDSSIMSDENENPVEKIDLSGIECFAFQYTVQWPVSIVLNQTALSQYQMLFRLLFYLKHVERQLLKVWIENGCIRRCSTNVANRWRTTFALRQRMLMAIQHIEIYMMVEIIEPKWHTFIEKMKTVENIDDVMVIHQDFLHGCLQNCMLNNPDLLRPVMNMCYVCLKFSRFVHVEPKKVMLSAWSKAIDVFSNEFSNHVRELLTRINNVTAEANTGTKLINLVCRLNFNSFYTEELYQTLTKESPVPLHNNNNDSNNKNNTAAAATVKKILAI